MCRQHLFFPCQRGRLAGHELVTDHQQGGCTVLKKISVTDAVGKVLSHDITEIRPWVMAVYAWTVRNVFTPTARSAKACDDIFF